MLKLIGGLMIVFASGWTGLAPAARLRRQLALLEQLDGALSLMRAELTSSLTPLPDLFKKLALSLDGVAAQLFDRLSRDMLSQPLSTPLHLMRKNLPTPWAAMTCRASSGCSTRPRRGCGRRKSAAAVSWIPRPEAGSRWVSAPAWRWRLCWYRPWTST